MNLKKFAIRGIVILAICVALCMFFSGTVRTITTPKVRLTAAKRGKLEERVELACKPAFPEVEEIGFSLDDDASLTIVKVNTREGYTVQEGDVLVEAKVANYDQLRKTAQESYDSASEALDMAPSYIGLVFRKVGGTSFLKYLTDIRMEEAKRLLRTTDLTLREIGLRVGIENQNTLIRTFKKAEGITPGQYRVADQSIHSQNG